MVVPTIQMRTRIGKTQVTMGKDRALLKTVMQDRANQAHRRADTQGRARIQDRLKMVSLELRHTMNDLQTPTRNPLGAALEIRTILATGRLPARA